MWSALSFFPLSNSFEGWSNKAALKLSAEVGKFDFEIM